MVKTITRADVLQDLQEIAARQVRPTLKHCAIFEFNSILTMESNKFNDSATYKLNSNCLKNFKLNLRICPRRFIHLCQTNKRRASVLGSTYSHFESPSGVVQRWSLLIGRVVHRFQTVLGNTMALRISLAIHTLSMAVFKKFHELKKASSLHNLSTLSSEIITFKACSFNTVMDLRLVNRRAIFIQSCSVLKLASHADFLRVRHAFLPHERLLTWEEKNVDQSQQTSRSEKCTLDPDKFRAWLYSSRKGQHGLMKGEDLTVLEKNYWVNSQAFLLVATLTISLKKITTEVKFAERMSALLQNNEKKNSAFCSVLQGNPAVVSPKGQLYVQTTSNPAFTERSIQQRIAYLLDCRLEQKSLVTYHTLQSLSVRMCLACQRTMGKEFVFRFSRRSWGRNAWRTPKNVCVGGYNY